MAGELRDEFPLSILEPALASFQPPQGDFEPGGDGTHRYALYTIGQRSLSQVGSVELRREAKPDGAVLRVTYRKRATGGFTVAFGAEIHCRADALATPSFWVVSCQTLRPDGKVVRHTCIEKTCAVKGKAIQIRDGNATRQVPTPEAYTVSWALFDAVQRLPRAAFEPKRFTLLDDFDVVKANQTLAYRKTVEVLLGGRRVQKQRWEKLEKGRIRKTSWGREGDRPVRLHAYEHLGDAIVPEVYYVDDQGRLLFMVAGIEAYVWEAA